MNKAKEGFYNLAHESAIRTAASALVDECESLIYYTRHSVDTGDLQAKVAALKTALETPTGKTEPKP